MFFVCCGLLLYGMGALFLGFVAERTWFQFRIYNAKRRAFKLLRRRVANYQWGSHK